MTRELRQRGVSVTKSVGKEYSRAARPYSSLARPPLSCDDKQSPSTPIEATTPINPHSPYRAKPTNPAYTPIQGKPPVFTSLSSNSQVRHSLFLLSLLLSISTLFSSLSSQVESIHKKPGVVILLTFLSRRNSRDESILYLPISSDKHRSHVQALV